MRLSRCALLSLKGVSPKNNVPVSQILTTKFTWPPRRRAQALKRDGDWQPGWRAPIRDNLKVLVTAASHKRTPWKGSDQDGSLGSVHHGRKRDRLGSVHLSLWIKENRLCAWAADQRAGGGTKVYRGAWIAYPQSTLIFWSLGGVPRK